jgi:hypothetical protein
LAIWCFFKPPPDFFNPERLDAVLAFREDVEDCALRRTTHRGDLGGAGLFVTATLFEGQNDGGKQLWTPVAQRLHGARKSYRNDKRKRGVGHAEFPKRTPGD